MLTIRGRLITPFVLGSMSVGLNILIRHSFMDLWFWITALVPWPQLLPKPRASARLARRTYNNSWFQSKEVAKPDDRTTHRFAERYVGMILKTRMRICRLSEYSLKDGHGISVSLLQSDLVCLSSKGIFLPQNTKVAWWAGKKRMTKF